MDFHILGPLEVLDKGRAVLLGGSRQRTLLGLLLLHANETLSTDRLVDELWGERAPLTAAKTLQVQVSRLRKALGDHAGVLVTREHGYQLALERGELDAHRFEDLLTEGGRELAAGRPDAAAAALEQALALWRGARGGVGGGAGARRETFATGDAMNLASTLGEAAGGGEILLDERTYGLVASGLRAEPAPEANAWRLLELNADEPVALNASATPFIGRERELGALREALARATRERTCRLVTVVGPAGIGKSRLAHELIAQAAGGATVLVG